MSHINKFPNGNDIVVVNKQDILDCIDKNIVDKEVLELILSRIEIDATNFIRNGYWTGIPFLGNIRIPKGIQLENSEENVKLREAAKASLDKEHYYMFRRDLFRDNAKRIKFQTYYQYELVKAINRNPKEYKRLCNKYSSYRAKILMFSRIELTAVSSECSLEICYDEQ